MKLSTERMLTTHVGSLPRSKELFSKMLARQAGKSVGEEEFYSAVGDDLRNIVRSQIDNGVDILSDGEAPRIGFSTYVMERMSGFGEVAAQRRLPSDYHRFPGYARLMAERTGSVNKMREVAAGRQCNDVVQYDPQLKLARVELDLFARAIESAGVDIPPGGETFVTAATPGIVAMTMLRSPDHPVYRDHREYVFALAEQLRHEYELIVARGHVLQLDAPDLALERHMDYQDRPLSEFLELVELHVAALNQALVNIPRDRVRLHVCWGNYDGPHADDVALEPLLPLLYQAKVGALSIACANPRHAHEASLFRKYPLPPEMALIPGVIDVAYNYLEHPRLVANRILSFVEVVGDRERVIASTDCGFSTVAGFQMVADDIVWAKLRALSEGARLATEELWGKPSAVKAAQ